MTKEITTYSGKNKPEKQLSRPARLLKNLTERFAKPIQVEVLLSNEEIFTRLETLYAVLKDEGSKTIRIDKDRYCKVCIHQINNALEIRVGSQQQVQAKRFHALKGLETFIQVYIGVSGEVFYAVQADLEKQSMDMLGAFEYDNNGSLTGGPQYHKGIDAVGVFTSSGLVTAALTDEMRHNAIQEIFEPVNTILWKLTEGES
jgi:hypothetical protein